MLIKEFFTVLIKSFSPDNIKTLMKYSLAQAVCYFLWLILFSIIISSAIFFIRYPDFKIDSKLDKFERFNISADVKLKEPVIINKFPEIVLDLTGNRTALQGADILISNKKVMWREFSPSIRKLSLFKVGEKDITQYQNVLDNRELFKKLAWIIFLLALPSLFLVLMLYQTMRFGIMILLISLILFVFRRKAKANFIKMGLFVSAPLVILDMIVSPFINLSILPVVVYLIYFIIGIFLTTEKDIKIKKKVFE